MAIVNLIVMPQNFLSKGNVSRGSPRTPYAGFQDKVINYIFKLVIVLNYYIPKSKYANFHCLL